MWQPQRNVHFCFQIEEKQRKEARERKEAGNEWKTKVSIEISEEILWIAVRKATWWTIRHFNTTVV